MSVKAKCTLFLLLGLAIGAIATAAIFGLVVIPKFNQALDEDQKVIQQQRNAMDLSSRAASNLSQQVISSVNRNNEEALRNLEQVTLLYDPQAMQSLAQIGGLVQVFPNERAIPYQGYPRWIIVGRVKPMIAGTSVGATYFYFNLKSQAYDGPFLPDVPRQRP